MALKAFLLVKSLKTENSLERICFYIWIWPILNQYQRHNENKHS